METINLPFTFKFYGQEYDEISICSNGWIAMGETDMESFRNYELPGMGGPAAMIAVFWVDLKLIYQFFNCSPRIIHRRIGLNGINFLLFYVSSCKETFKFRFLF